MTRYLAATFAALLQRWGRARHHTNQHPSTAAVSAMSALNQARRGHKHPSTPAYRHRPRAPRQAWPFPAGDTQPPRA